MFSSCCVQGVFGNGVCDVLVVPLTSIDTASNDERLSSVQSMVAAGSHGQYVAALVSTQAEDGAVRELSARHLLNGNKKFVYMTSDIMSGLLIGLLLFLTALVGVCCLMSIQTPTKFCMDPLPGSKEF